MLRKADFEKKEILGILLEYRCTTLPQKGASPCEFVMSRFLTTRFPVNENSLRLKVQVNDENRMLNSQANYEKYYDKITKTKYEFNANDDAVVNEGRAWVPCKVLSKLENYPRSYVVKPQNGQIVRRTLYYLRHTKGQHFIKNYEDNDDIILGVTSNEKVESEEKVNDSQSNEKSEITRTKVGRVVEKPTKLDIYDLSNQLSFVCM